LTQQREQLNRKLQVEGLIAANQLIAERQTGHEPSFFEPENGTETARKEYAFNAHEGHQPVREPVIFFIEPLEGPLGFLAHAVYRLDGPENFGFVGRVLFNQQTVGLAVHHLVVLLVRVKRPGFGDEHLVHEIDTDVFEHDTVRRGEKCKNVGYEVALGVGQLVVPIVHVGAEVDFLGRPVGRLGFFVKGP